MKLGRTLVLTGILFSSVLGSMNLTTVDTYAAAPENVAAPAQPAPKQPGTTTEPGSGTQKPGASTVPGKVTPVSKPQQHHTTSGSGLVRQTVCITFVNKSTNEEVGYQQVTGLSSYSKKIQAPADFELCYASDANVKFDKKGNKNIKVFVTEETPTVVSRKGVITTVSGQHKTLFTLQGQPIAARALSANSSWYTDECAVINGQAMYRVATNEWVKAADIK